MDPPGQPLSRWLCRRFWGFPPFSAFVETIALAVHFQNMDMVGETVQQGPGQTFRAEYLGPFIERQVGVRTAVTNWSMVAAGFSQLRAG